MTFFFYKQCPEALSRLPQGELTCIKQTLFSTSKYLSCVSVYVYTDQQARLATLYLPLFGLLQETVHRLNVRDTSNFNTNQVNHLLYFLINLIFTIWATLTFQIPSPQNGRDEHLASISTVTPQKPVGNLDNSLHKMYLGSSQELVSNKKTKTTSNSGLLPSSISEIIRRCFCEWFHYMNDVYFVLSLSSHLYA